VANDEIIRFVKSVNPPTRHTASDIPVARNLLSVRKRDSDANASSEVAPGCYLRGRV